MSSKVTIVLSADDAADAAQVLMGLAALVDPDDPDGLVGVDLDGLVLTDRQLALLHTSARYRPAERAGVARELRRIAATIVGQIR